ncbi:uncharacterized protein RJT21DRAFT_112164 [Scheffersomyces amazonensis]|uniref:uncharacterized protein n=1 Tax=Scheffersomyces amazonensis TaxID=1078765 RepID=UPI00315D3BE8
MSTYEDDHNIDNRPVSRNNDNTTRTHRPRQHQTLSSAIEFFLTQENTGAVTETPTDEVFANALRFLSEDQQSEVVVNLLSQINDNDDITTPLKKQKKGVEQEFIDALERVPLNKIKKEADCPICTNKFVDNDYPLIVKLPCLHTKVDHIFDLECIGPWLKFNSTCPLCRFDVLEADKFRKEKLAEELKKLREEDEEEEDDDWELYG